MSLLSRRFRALGDRLAGDPYERALARGARERRKRVVFFWNRGLGDIALGLLAPSAGEVLVNGRSIRDLRSELGAYAGLVPQNFFILDDTIRRNVAFGVPDPDIDDGRVWHALELARVAERVRTHAGGLGR